MTYKEKFLVAIAGAVIIFILYAFQKMNRPNMEVGNDNKVELSLNEVAPGE